MEEIKKHMRELEEKLLYHSKKYYDDAALRVMLPKNSKKSLMR